MLLRDLMNQSRFVCLVSPGTCATEGTRREGNFIRIVRVKRAIMRVREKYSRQETGIKKLRRNYRRIGRMQWAWFDRSEHMLIRTLECERAA